MATLNYTVRIIDKLLRFDTTHGNVVVTLLPFAQTPNAPYEIHRVSNGDGNTVTVQTDSTTSDTLLPNGARSITLDDDTFWTIVRVPGDASSPAFVTVGGARGGSGAGYYSVVAWDIEDSNTGADVAKHIGVLQAATALDLNGVFTVVGTSDLAVQVKLAGSPIGNLTIPAHTPNTTVVSTSLTPVSVPLGSVPTLDIVSSDGACTAVVWLRMTS